ncbi:unnamed protein product, partial [Discosporangium mesarthrocarpum]
RGQVKDCLVYLRLVANPRDVVALRRAINTPARGIGTKTQQALHDWCKAARNMPGMEACSPPECLMALLEPSDMEALEMVLRSTPGQEEASQGGRDLPLPPSESEEGGGKSDGWEDGMEGAAGQLTWVDFSVDRVKELSRLLGLSGERDLEGMPTKAQAKKLRDFARLLVRLRVAADTESVPGLLEMLLEETGMEKHVKETLATKSVAEGEERWQNVMELCRAASNPKFKGAAASAGSLEAFLNTVSLMSADDVDEEAEDLG